MASQPMNPDAVIARVKLLLNAQLKAVCKAVNLPVSGAKAALQQRIIAQINTHVARNDFEAFNRVRNAVFHPEQDLYSYSSPPSPAARSFQPDTRQQPTAPYQPQYTTGAARPMMPSPNGNATASNSRNPMFKTSPFYNIISGLTPVLEMKGLADDSSREQTRDNVQTLINLREDIATRLVSDKDIRAMVFCAADSMSSPFQRVDIAFPYQIEIRVNQDEVKANLRGLKNKPGSTRPADITAQLRKRAGYENHLQVTYALTTKKYYLIVNLVQLSQAPELAARLKASNRRITKERVLNEMKSRADDPDIVATSTILSLKCPLSTLRMKDPCRSTVCSHNQCFDGTSFLQLQEQAPTWTCPICNKVIGYEMLQIDEYVDEILKSTPRDLEQVTVEPDGKWSISTKESRSPGPGVRDTRSSSSEFDDDLVEIQDVLPAGPVKREQIPDGFPLRTPPISSREDSAPSIPQTTANSSGKRPASAVVDLTLSSDEDDDPIRPAKRQAVPRLPPLVHGLPGSENIPLRAVGIPNIVSEQDYHSNPF